MATGSASRNSTTSEGSLDLAFLTLSSDCETWLTGPNEGQNQSESISTQEWLDGALRNSQYDHTKLHRIMQSQKKQKKRVIHDLPSHPSSLLTSVTEEHDKISSRTSDNTYLKSQIGNGSDEEDEFFDASTNFEEEAAAEYKSVAPLNNQNHGTIQKSYQPIISPRNVNTTKSNYIKPNVTSVPQASPRQNMIAPQISKNQPKQLSPQIINTYKVAPKISPRRENSVPNDKASSKPSIIGTCKIPAVNNNAMSKSGIRPPTFSANTISRQHHTPTNVNTSPQTSNVGSNKSSNVIISNKSFLEMSRKIEEQEKRLLEEALQGKKHDSRPSSSASTNGEIIVKEDSGAPCAAANIPTSKSVDFKGALRLTAAGRSTSTRIPMYGRTASVASTLHRIPKPRPNVITKVLPPASPNDTSNDPWGDNCF